MKSLLQTQSKMKKNKMRAAETCANENKLPRVIYRWFQTTTKKPTNDNDAPLI